MSGILRMPDDFPKVRRVLLDGVGTIAAEDKPRVHAYYAAKYGLDIFVECGSNLGGSIRPALAWAKQVHSVELSEEYHLHCRRAFVDEPRVQLAWGSSVSWLGPTIERLSGARTAPMLIYLDTHAEPDTTRQELEVLALNSLVFRSVILVDDMRWMAPPQPKIDPREFPYHDVAIFDDMVHITPRKFA